MLCVHSKHKQERINKTIHSFLFSTLSWSGLWWIQSLFWEHWFRPQCITLHTFAHSFTPRDNLALPTFHIPDMFLDGGMKSENLEESHIKTRRTHNTATVMWSPCLSAFINYFALVMLVTQAGSTVHRFYLHMNHQTWTVCSTVSVVIHIWLYLV